MKSPFAFRQHGRCGRWVSELFPHLADCVDDLTFIHSMQAKSSNHTPAAFCVLFASYPLLWAVQAKADMTPRGYFCCGFFAALATTFELPGYRVTKSFGVVRGIIVRSRSIIGNFGASIQAIFGGNI